MFRVSLLCCLLLSLTGCASILEYVGFDAQNAKSVRYFTKVTPREEGGVHVQAPNLLEEGNEPNYGGGDIHLACDVVHGRVLYQWSDVNGSLLSAYNVTFQSLYHPSTTYEVSIDGKTRDVTVADKSKTEGTYKVRVYDEFDMNSAVSGEKPIPLDLVFSMYDTLPPAYIRGFLQRVEEEKAKQFSEAVASP